YLDDDSSFTGTGHILVQGASVFSSGSSNVTGTFTLIYGSVDFGGDTNVFSTLNLIGGELTGIGTVTVPGTLNWNGTTQSGDGLTIATGILALDTTSAYLLLSERHLINEGTGTWIGNNNFYMDFNATLDNRGSLDIQADGSIYVLNDGELIV